MNRTNDFQTFDIIGDIHGHGDELVSLLHKLGYEPDGGCYGHPDGNRVIYLGDFIDRGPKHRLVLDTVKPMVEQGTALSIMGNHEFNAICFNTPDPDNASEYLRPRITKNIKQHEAFLEAYPDQEERNEVIEWFKTLPLWLDLGDFRAIHACWHEDSINKLTSILNEDNTLSESGFIQASRKGTDAYHAVETLLKGVETSLPDGEKFHDEDGNPRYEIRTQWWKSHARTFAEASLQKVGVDHLANYEIPENLCHGYPADAPPLFIGHYWLKGAPEPLLPNLACLDYSVAMGGHLTAYRWCASRSLSDSGFVSCFV